MFRSISSISKSFFAKVNEHLQTYPCLLVVVSEGVRNESGNPISEYEIGGSTSSTIPGGVAQLLSSELRDCGIPSRGENLGTLQRSNTWTVCERDRQEAIFLGGQAVKVLQEGNSNVMLGLQGKAVGLTDEARVQLVTFRNVAGMERPLDPNFLTEYGIDQSFMAWLQSRMGEPLASSDSERQVVWI